MLQRVAHKANTLTCGVVKALVHQLEVLAISFVEINTQTQMRVNPAIDWTNLTQLSKLAVTCTMKPLGQCITCGIVTPQLIINSTLVVIHIALLQLTSDAHLTTHILILLLLPLLMLLVPKKVDIFFAQIVATMVKWMALSLLLTVALIKDAGNIAQTMKLPHFKTQIMHAELTMNGLAHTACGLIIVSCPKPVILGEI